MPYKARGISPLTEECLEEQGSGEGSQRQAIAQIWKFQWTQALAYKN